MIRSAFTIDVECAINILMRDYFKVEMPPTERVVNNTRVILKLLHEHQTNATFFILGDVARNYPALVKEIAANGHEIGVHSYAHNQLFKLSPDEAYADTKLARDVIQDITGSKVFGFRAPAFSLMPKTSWALPMLADLGFTYDSSIMPVTTSRYGWPNFPKTITEIDLQNGRLIMEFPLSVIKILYRQIPCCGGGYLKLFPFWFTKNAFSKISKSRPVNLYIHPYEIDTEKYPDYFFDAVKTLPVKRQMKVKTFRINKGTVHHKLDMLLGKFSFDTCKNLIDEHVAQNKIARVQLGNILPAKN